MTWHIPAKTFLLGEYAAIAGEAAILLTTTPCFELALTNTSSLPGIHPESPAGRFWHHAADERKGLLWTDPYQGKGGLGASSAQFIACYLAHCDLQQQKATLEGLLSAYDHYAWDGQGLRPSGYDVIAQSQDACVYIDKNQKQVQSLSWDFSELGFLLMHTGKKLATHSHLRHATLPSEIESLASISRAAKTAFITADDQLLIHAVNNYHQQLSNLDLVAEHSLHLINAIKQDQRVLAIKGCGAMGADVILILCKINDVDSLSQMLRSKNMTLLAHQEQLWNGPFSLENRINLEHSEYKQNF